MVVKANGIENGFSLSPKKRKNVLLVLNTVVLTFHSPPILAEMLDIGYIAVLAILMDLMVKYSINHHKIDF